VPRPKRPFSGLTDITAREDKYHKEGRNLGFRREGRWNSTVLKTYRVPNAYNDPLCHFIVLHTLLNADENVEFRSRHLADYLNLSRPQFGWDAVTVGKILSDLHESFETLLGEKSGLTTRGRDQNGYFYVLHTTEPVIQAAWGVLDDLQGLVEVQMTLQNQGKPVERAFSPLLESTTLRGAFKDE
jgi:hypothetical protein